MVNNTSEDVSTVINIVSCAGAEDVAEQRNYDALRNPCVYTDLYNYINDYLAILGK